ncbi:MAG: hypothetical protein JO264_17845 [Acidisphaera sp.]|nr:hypothetical protein [Acidisphaera sp.]
MSDTLSPLVLDLLEWISAGPRPYAEVMQAWRTSCPRLPVWEDAVDHGFVLQRRTGRDLLVELTPSGRDFLAGNGRCRRSEPAPEIPG